MRALSRAGNVAVSGLRLSGPAPAIHAVFYLLFGVLLAFDNLPGFYDLNGLSTGSPSLLVVIGLAFLLPRSNRLLEIRYTRLWGFVLVFGVLSIAVSMILYNAGTDVLALKIGSDIVWEKALKTFLIVLFWVLALLVGYRLVAINPEYLFWVGVGLSMTNIVALFLQISGTWSSGSIDWAHALRWHEDRPRGFKFESSVFGASLVAGLALVGLRGRAKSTWLFLVPALLLASYLSSSRGAFLAVVAGIGVILLGSFLSRTLGPVGIPLLRGILYLAIIVVAFLGFYVLTAPIWSPLQSAGSDATRSGWGLLALRSLVHAPSGLNLFNYWFEVQPAINEVAQNMQSTFAPRDLLEFSLMATADSDSGLSPKSLPAVMAVWFGIPGLVASLLTLVEAMVSVTKNIRGRRVWGGVGVCATAFCLATFVPGIFLYETALVIGAGIGIFGTSKDDVEQQRR